MDDKTLFGGKTLVASRQLSKITTEAAKRFSFETTHNFKQSRDSKSTATKSGSVNASGSLETTLSIELLSNSGDALQIQKAAMASGETMEYWRIFGDQVGSAADTVKAQYMRGKVTSYEEDADADGFVTAKMEVAVDGKPQDGEVAYSEDVDGQYVFTDLKPVAGQG